MLSVCPKQIVSYDNASFFGLFRINVDNDQRHTEGCQQVKGQGQSY